MKKGKKWKKYGFEFLSIFIAVITAFALNNWNDNRNDNLVEQKILTEIRNGLEKDLDDVVVNKNGHSDGIKACKFWRNVIMGNEVKKDSLMQHYFNLTRDFISIQNISGYETLKSRGLELLKNDSLRFSIISLYEYDYSILRKFEEEYTEMQFQESYFEKINNAIAPNFIFNELGNIIDINLPIDLSKKEQNILLSYLWKIENNRNFISFFYAEVEKNIKQVKLFVEEEL